ncbi:hypothetical protein V2H45_00425 [Tumidithrix elongata RA019]|uniref:Uncharacterized protein n=1 Tax=Tumidithrix elongata BACA0141 TaxID=2716417 RepID=A0AAW9PSD9_9CYAN|nr:hypothetical protein [Tumidithrix elongata RA019]
MTPHWHQIKSDNTDVHDILERIAAKVYEQDSTTVTISQADEVNLKLAIEYGYLESTNDRVSFVSSEIQLDYLTRYVADLLHQLWEDEVTFLDIFRQIASFRTHIGDPHKIVNLAIILITQEYGRDLVDLIIRAATLRNSDNLQEKMNFWKLYELFFELAPNLTVESKAILNLFDALGENFDRGRGQVYGIIENITSQSPEEAEYFYGELLLRSKSPVCHLLIDVLRGIANSDLPKAHQRALLLSESKEPIIRRLGICSLGNFDYSQDSSQILLGSTLERFKTLLESSDPETDYMLVRAYGELLRHTSEVETVIVELSNSPKPAIWKQVMDILFMQAVKANMQGWYGQTLLNLVLSHELSSEDLPHLDHCIEKYVVDKPEFTFQIIETLASRWKFARHEGYKRLPDGLNSTFIALSKNQKTMFTAKFTEWVASNHHHLHLLAFETNEYFNPIPVRTEGAEVDHNKNSFVILNKEVLDTLDEQIVCNILYRIAGYGIHASSLSALLLSSLKREQCSPKVISLVQQLLTSYVLYNYPRDAGDYLQKKLQEQNVTQLEKYVIQSALSNSNQYFEDRQKLPRLKELQPSSKQTYLLGLAHWKQQAEIMEKAEGRSIFAQMVTSVVYKYGRAFSSEHRGEFSEPSPFVLHSISTERPQGELIDPIGQAYQRLRWQSVDLRCSDNNDCEGGRNE